MTGGPAHTTNDVVVWLARRHARRARARHPTSGRTRSEPKAERIVGNLHRADADLTVPVEERGGPIDFPEALGLA